MSGSRSSLLNSTTELDDVQVHVSSKQKKPSLLRALMRVIGSKLLQAHLCKLLADVLTFCGPLLQRFASWLLYSPIAFGDAVFCLKIFCTKSDKMLFNYLVSTICNRLYIIIIFPNMYAFKCHLKAFYILHTYLTSATHRATSDTSVSVMSAQCSYHYGYWGSIKHCSVSLSALYSVANSTTDIYEKFKLCTCYMKFSPKLEISQLCKSSNAGHSVFELHLEICCVYFLYPD